MEQLTHDVIENVAENESKIIVGNDWSDEDCVKILKNCKKAIGEKGIGR